MKVKTENFGQEKQQNVFPPLCNESRPDEVSGKRTESFLEKIGNMNTSQPQECPKVTKISAYDPILGNLPVRKRSRKTKIDTQEHASLEINNLHKTTSQSLESHNKALNNRKSKWNIDFINGETLALEGRKYVVPNLKKDGNEESTLLKKTASEKVTPALNIKVDRTDEVMIHRQNLPVYMEEQIIMDAVNNNDVIIINAETGSGKSTQIPQFLYEAGYGDPRSEQHPGTIVITEPRRIAAIFMAKRVEYELNQQNNENSVVGYQVRYDSSNISNNTKIKFVTEGILLNELTRFSNINISKNNEQYLTSQPSTKNGDISSENEYLNPGDLLLSKYSSIIIDEAHEMSVSTDVLLGWLTKICHIRSKRVFKDIKPLKLVIMSATLNTDVFLKNKLFSKTDCKLKVVEIPGRRHKVVIHYNRITPQSYLKEAYSKITKIHKRLPQGDVLVFLSGKVEVETLCYMLRKFDNCEKEEILFDDNIDTEMSNDVTSYLFDCPNNDDSYFPHVIPHTADEISESIDLLSPNMPHTQNSDPTHFSDDEENLSILHGDIPTELQDNHNSPESITTHPDNFNAKKQQLKLRVLPLYASLPSHAQKLVFKNTNDNVRTVIIATNIAETSVTLPNIKYVVDSGKVKQRKYNSETSSYTFKVDWTDKSSADQRAGRAGRVGPGHCYRLYSSAVFHNKFSNHIDPEILRVGLEEVYINLKAIGIENVSTFPFFTPPQPKSIRNAEEILKELGCIDSVNKKITTFGLLASKFPINPRYFKIIVTSASYNTKILARTISIVSTVISGELFISEVTRNSNKNGNISTNADFSKKMETFEGKFPTSDFIKMLKVFGAFCVEKLKSKQRGLEFCKNYYVKYNEMEESLNLYNQLCHYVYTYLSHDKFPSAKNILDYIYPNVVKVLSPPSLEEESILRFCILSGLTDRIALLDCIHSKENTAKKYSYITKEKDINEKGIETCYIDHGSCLKKLNTPPKWICFSEMLNKNDNIKTNDNANTNHNTNINDNTNINYNTNINHNKNVNNNTDSQTLLYSLRLVTIIEPEWIAHLVSEPRIKKKRFMEPPQLPWYDTSDNCVKLLAEIILLPQNWPLPPKPSQFENPKLSCAWFARLLLEGKVHAFSYIEKHQLHNKLTRSLFSIMAKYILKSPSTIINQVNVDPRDNPFLFGNPLAKLFVANDIRSLDTLCKHRSTNINFMLPEYMKFFPESIHDPIKKVWISRCQIVPSSLDQLERDILKITSV